MRMTMHWFEWSCEKIECGVIRLTWDDTSVIHNDYCLGLLNIIRFSYSSGSLHPFPLFSLFFDFLIAKASSRTQVLRSCATGSEVPWLSNNQLSGCLSKRVVPVSVSSVQCIRLSRMHTVLGSWDFKVQNWIFRLGEQRSKRSVWLVANTNL